MNSIETLLLAMSIPSAVTGFCFWWLEHKINRKEVEEERKRERHQKDQEEKEKLREESQFLILQAVNASIALGEATAKAVQRIPDAHCNGDMSQALEYATKIKHKQKEHLMKQGIQNIYDE